VSRRSYDDREASVTDESAASSSPAGSLRARILAAGELVFARAGYAGATVDDIISAAQTSRATFYRYYTSKDDLFRELSRACFRDMRAVIRAFALLDTGGGARREDLEQLVAAYRRLHSRHGGVIRAWTERAAPPDSPLRPEATETFDALLGEMARALRETGAPSGVDIEVQAALIFLAIERSSYFVSNRHSRVDPDRLAPTLATMLHRAYFGAPSPGQRRRLRIATG
jgi:AcrR family transcriptional regulator